VGDEFYAGRKIARQDRIWCPRLFLHAAKIRFFHPKDGKEMLFSAKLPEDLEKTLHGLLKAK
jgi:23S rRNA-/tRNA-specific pseudouridylate synthase